MLQLQSICVSSSFLKFSSLLGFCFFYDSGGSLRGQLSCHLFAPNTTFIMERHIHTCVWIFILQFSLAGEVWTGSESGSMRAWSCEVISSGLMWAAKGDFAACALLTNASILLRGPAISAPLQTEVLFLVAEHSHCCIWAGELNHITLWYVSLIQFY